MINKIKAEIEWILKDETNEYGSLEAMKKCLKWAEELEKELIEKIEYAQEDFANLNWVSKDQIVKIIKKAFHSQLNKQEVK